MECHQRKSIIFYFIQFINFRDECDFFEEMEKSTFGRKRIVFMHDTDKFLNILPALFSFISFIAYPAFHTEIIEKFLCEYTDNVFLSMLPITLDEKHKSFNTFLFGRLKSVDRARIFERIP